jgi:N-acetylglucosaminyldiphosphoundecaprenol N-acetyl-beta-D-mannosaminyltransferase
MSSTLQHATLQPAALQPPPMAVEIPQPATRPQRIVRRKKPVIAPATRVHIGNLGIDTYSETALADHVLDHAFNGRRTRQIITANAQFYVLAEKNPRFRECLEAAEYSCADGMPIVWACERFAGTKVPRITGVDFISMLCERGARDGLRIYLVGGRPGTAQATADILKEKFPGVQIAGVDCPDWGFETSEATLKPVLQRIAAAKPHILLAGLGAPKQEFFIHEHIRPIKIPIAIGIGGSFEILSGSLQRAPLWFQTHGLEWAFRLAQEPRRLLKRYLTGNAEFLWDIAKWRLRVMRNSSPLPSQVKSS